MSSKERIIAYSIIFILLSTLVYFVFLGDSKYVEDYNLKIDALEAKVDSLHHINDDLVYKIDTLNQEITKLDSEIEFQDKKIVTLNIKVNEKVNSVDNFNDDELLKFFTDRYRKIDSTESTNSEARN
jgi:uncharacterized coiled-coil protein SlyX